MIKNLGGLLSSNELGDLTYCFWRPCLQQFDVVCYEGLSVHLMMMVMVMVMVVMFVFLCTGLCVLEGEEGGGRGKAARSR